MSDTTFDRTVLYLSETSSSTVGSDSTIAFDSPVASNSTINSDSLLVSDSTFASESNMITIATARTELKNRIKLNVVLNNDSPIITNGMNRGLAFDEKVVMFDGTFKEIKDLNLGELLMGDDSTPRTILNIYDYIGELFKIVPLKGEPYVINGHHMISLVSTHKPRCNPDYKNLSKTAIMKDGKNGYTVIWTANKKKNYKFFRSLTDESKRQAHEFMKTLPQIEYIDITLIEYMNKSVPWRCLYKGYKSPPTEWPEQEVPLDPYILGAWLGDGTSADSSITNVDKEILDHLTSLLDGMDLKMTPRSEMSITYCIASKNPKKHHPNKMTVALRRMNLIKNKHIPLIYKINSKAIRLALLAGVLDTDGYYNQDGNEYEIVQKRKTLADDIAFVARSLGYSVTTKEITKVCTNAPGGPRAGIYHLCRIGGSGLEEIPVKLSRKVARERLQIKDALRFGFTIEPLGIGNCRYFKLDGNQRFLLKDFIVT